MKSKPKKLRTLGKAYAAGWNQKDKQRGELYLTILNDLAEDIDIPGRHTRENLAEVLGWMQREAELSVQHLAETAQKLVAAGADCLSGGMEKGLFRKKIEPKKKKKRKQEIRYAGSLSSKAV